MVLALALPVPPPRRRWRQLRLALPAVMFERRPRAPRVVLVTRTPVALIQLPLPFDAPRRAPTPAAAPAPVAPLGLRLLQPVGGPDPAKPCEGCPRRLRCKSPCHLLSALLGPEEIIAWNEVSSPALMAGRGYDEAFMVMPEALLPEPDTFWPEIVARFGPSIHAALHLLTAQQRDVIELYLSGHSRAEVGQLRQTSRQATHKVFWAAVGRLARELGPLPDRAALAAKRARREGLDEGE